MVAGAFQVNEKSRLTAAPGKLPFLRAHGMTPAMRERGKMPGHPAGHWKSGPFGGQKPRRGRRGPPAARPDADGPAILYGWHAVKAALDNPRRRIRRLYATENAARRLHADGTVLALAPQIVRPDEIARRLSADAVHNGLLAEADPLPSPGLDEIEPAGIVLVLDQITDPHNVGAIFRSAAAFGAGAIVTTARHSPEATGALAKAASGALEFVPFVTIQNLARALAALGERGFLRIGLDSEAQDTLEHVPLSSPVALVLGAEGKGLRQLTRDTCDHLARLDLPGPIKSLNVSNAAALALHVASSRLKAAGR